MQSTFSALRPRAHLILTALFLAVTSPIVPALAQAPAAPATTSEATIKLLQESLSKQGIPVAATGVLNDDTRAAIRKYQSQHHLPVTGEPDQATLDKLGIRVSSASPAQTTAPAGASTTQAQPSTPPTSMQPGQMGPGMQMGGGMMMNCPMMQGQMQAMMQMMQGMMQMMQTMHAQMQPGQMQAPMPGQMQPGQTQPMQPQMPAPMQPGAR